MHKADSCTMSTKKIIDFKHKLNTTFEISVVIFELNILSVINNEENYTFLYKSNGA